MRRKLPEDYAINALALEADRRAKARGHRYSYGQLVADTTLEERQQIAEEYRQSIRRGNGKSEIRNKPIDDDEDIKRILEKAHMRCDGKKKPGE